MSGMPNEDGLGYSRLDSEFDYLDHVDRAVEEFFYERRKRGSSGRKRRSPKQIRLVKELVSRIKSHPDVTAVQEKGSRAAECKQHNVKVSKQPNGLSLLVLTRFGKYAFSLVTAKPKEVEEFVYNTWSALHT